MLPVWLPQTLYMYDISRLTACLIVTVMIVPLAQVNVQHHRLTAEANAACRAQHGAAWHSG